MSNVGYSDGSGFGIFEKKHDGYEMQDTISFSANGASYKTLDRTKLFIVNYHDDQGPGIELKNDGYGQDASIDMRGLLHPGGGGDIAGYNTIANNNLLYSSNSGEIKIDSGGSLYLGNGTNHASQFYGKNNIIENLGLDKLLYGNYASGYSNALLPDDSGNLEDNYYEVNGAAYHPSNVHPDTAIAGVAAHGKILPYSVLSSPASITGIGCTTQPTGGSVAQNRYNHIAAVETHQEECSHLASILDTYESTGWFEVGYDTTKYFLTNCYDQPYSERGFGDLGACNDGRKGGETKYVEEREFLKSVLYLRQDSRWYCSDVVEIAGSLKYFEGRGLDLSGIMAIDKYLLESHKCDSGYYARDYADASRARLQNYNDTVQNRQLTPYDTTLPTIDDLKLGILRGPVQGVNASGSFEHHNGAEFSELHASENPFTHSTSIEFDLQDYGLVRFELYDPLGRLITSNGIGQVLYPGPHSFNINGNDLGRGVYYARISFHNGLTKTITIRKE